MSIIEAFLPGLVPSFAAILAAAVVILISNSFPEAYQKIMFQFFVFGLALALSIGWLIAQPDPTATTAAWEAFSALSWETRFVITLVVVTGSYFGAGMYIAAPERNPDLSGLSGEQSDNVLDVYKCPASVDNVVGFEIDEKASSDDKVFFEQLLYRLNREFVQDLPTVYEMPAEAVAWVARMLDYTVAGGKMNRGLSVLATHKTLMEATRRKQTPRQRYQAAALGWCVEYLQAFFLVADDLMDGSITRRGNPCWYRLAEVKLIAINDSFILESVLYKLLKKYFGNERYYYQLVDLFLETTRQTEFGQLLDLTSQPAEGAMDFNRFTMERYSSIVIYKTAFYSFYLPVALAMIMAGINDVKLYQQARKILLIMGEYFQIQDDYLDCYGTPEMIGKIGTDIQDKKCSWLVVQALKRATPAQRAILEENYGQHDETKINRVKELYHEMKLKELFEEYEERSYKEIQDLLSEVKTMPREIFDTFLKKIYKRSK